LHDLFLAQGFLTAQDRMWQIDGMRRYAAGELSEILGQNFLQHDREQRILSLRPAARRAVETASPEVRAQLDAYASGVNAYLEAHRNNLPLEFRILRYTPRPWSAEDSMLISAQMVRDLNLRSFEESLGKEKILARLGPELTADLYVNSSLHDRPPTESFQIRDDDSTAPGNDEEDNDEEKGPDSNVAFSGSITPSLPGLPRLAMEAGDPFELGSNNWVISGAHTVSGKPLLSNDMHLGHQMPNLWYQVDLNSGNFHVAGVSLPGVPFVIVGHNQHIAWGFTNVGPTVDDLYIETFNDAGQYLAPEGWVSPERRREVIRVKDGQDVSFDVLTTRHGPIVTDLIPGESRKLALRWTLYDGMRFPFLRVDAAQNWDEFRQAFSELDAPGQNVVYADVEGNIGYQATGKVPIRAAGDGTVPVDGSDKAHDWIGWLPYDKMPHILNPPSGIIATANGRITPDRYPYLISSSWEAPWRTARIYRVLGSGKKFSVADMLSLQTDITSDFDRFVAERFVYAVDHAAQPSARLKNAAEILRNWDGRMLAGSAAPTIEYYGRMELVRMLLEPKLGPDESSEASNRSSLSWKSYHWPMRSVWTENVLLRHPQRWLPQNYQSYDDLLAAALQSALSAPEAPQQLAEWKWGEFNAIEIQNPVLGQIPLLRKWTGPGVQPQSGSGFSVKAVTKDHGPSERMTVDLANLDRSTLNLVTGEAGNFLSPYYMNQWKAWYDGTTFPWPFTHSAVEQAAQHRLVLEPEK
jgi:penicillin amidase